MNEQPCDDVTILNANTWSRVRVRILMYLICGGLGAAFSVSFYLIQPVITLGDAWGLVIFSFLMCLMIFLAIITFSGMWIIDGDGITHSPLFVASWRLDWTEIERVLWMHDAVLMRGRGRQICIKWNFYDPREVQVARARLEKILSADFDLTEYSVPSEAIMRTEMRFESPPSFARIIRLIAIAIIFGIPWLAVFGLIAFAEPHAPNAPGQGLLSMTYLILSLIIVAFPLVRLERRIARERRQVNPEYPWRRRGWRVPEWARKMKDPVDSHLLD